MQELIDNHDLKMMEAAIVRPIRDNGLATQTAHAKQGNPE
jgi:hypothetical protein